MHRQGPNVFDMATWSWHNKESPWLDSMCLISFDQYQKGYSCERMHQKVQEQSRLFWYSARSRPGQQYEQSIRLFVFLIP